MMKKIFALLVVFAMALCFVACGPTETPTPEENACTDHVDNDGNGICDTEGCGAVVEKNDCGNTGDGGNEGEGSELADLAKALVGEGAALTKIAATGEYVKDVFVDANGKGYVVHLLVMSQYGTPETETLVYINAEGKLAGVNKMIWKTSDAMYGYVPPEAAVVDAFYAKLTGKTAAEFKAAFTGEGVELVTNATSTSTKLVASILEAFEIVEKVENGAGSTTPVDPDKATGYVNAIWSAVESAKTITATLDMTEVTDNSDTVNAENEVLEAAYYSEIDLHMDITLAMTENGISVKVIGAATRNEIYEGESYDEDQKIEIYIVDGVGYIRTAYGEEWGEWTVEAIEIPEEATGMITQLIAIITEAIPEDFEVTPEMIAEIKGTIVELVSAMMGVNPDGSFGVFIDTKPAIDAMLSFVKDIKAEDTIGTVINKVLALIDPEMTVEAILDEVGTYGSVTIGDIYTALNDAFVTEFGMSINDMKNAVLANEGIVNVIIESGMADAETLAAIAEADVEVMIAEYTEMTIDDIVYMFLAAQSAPEDSVQPMGDEPVEEPVDTTGMLAAMVTEIKGMLAMTVDAMFDGDFESVMDIIESIDMRACYGYMSIKIADDLSIDKIEIGAKFDCTVKAVMEYTDKTEGEDGEVVLVSVPCTATVTTTQQIVFTITSVSNAQTVITAPEIAEEVPAE